MSRLYVPFQLRIERSASPYHELDKAQTQQLGSGPLPHLSGER